MSVRLSHRIEGLDDALGALREVQKHVDISATAGKRVIREALKQAAEPVRWDAEARAPHDPAPDGEHLREHIDISARVRDSRSSGEASVAIGFHQETFWGGFQELGTAHHAPQPFLRPALDAKQDEAARRFGEAMRDEIEALAKRRARRIRRG